MGENESTMLLAMLEEQKTYEEACFDAMFAGVRLSSLLSPNHHDKYSPPPPFALPEYAIGDSSSTFQATPLLPNPATFTFFSEEYPALSSEKNQLMTAAEGSSSVVDFMAEKLRMPKCEPLYDLNFGGHHHQFESVSPNLGDYQLPYLQSLEEVQHEFSLAESSSSSSRKRVRRRPASSYSPATATAPAAMADYTLDAIVRSFKPSPRDFPIPTAESKKAIARKRRAKIGDKAKCLQQLMPWKKKMNMATLLGEAYKYIKFLEAQVSVLESMPCESSFEVQLNPSNGGYVIGGLNRLKRQELLEVLLNSTVAQTMMYSQGCCVFSIEQFALLRKIAQRKYLMQQQQQLLFDPSELT